MPFLDSFDLALYTKEEKFPARIIAVVNGTFNQRKEPLCLKNRETSKDIEILTSLLLELGMSKSDGDVLFIKQNMTKAEMEKLFYDESKNVDWDKFGMLIVVIMSHGYTGHVYDTEKEVVKVDALMENFRGMKCEKLVGKPKLFIIQACEHEFYQRAGRVVSDAGSSKMETKASCIPSEADFLILWSHIPGTVMWRDWASEGSIFFSKLKEAFKNDDFKGLELRKLMTRVNQMVCEELQSHSPDDFRRSGYRLPYIVDMLTKELYFHTARA